MYIAMNRFSVPSANAQAFEKLWLGRDSHLKELNGFVEFHMLRGPETDGLVLFASHTVWTSENTFLDWTRSEAFKAAHKGAKSNSKLYEGPPQFEGFSTIQTIA